eukprot:724347-Prorocentrum_minimum.AAC.1
MLLCWFVCNPDNVCYVGMYATWWSDLFTCFPSQPIHCVVWAKAMLFGRLFGKPDETTDLDTE